jgi:pimeloyl-ACP methyl ester carboxylesterase
VHGANPNLDWQPKLQEMLEPHFNCIPHRYTEYDSLYGPVAVIFNLHVLGVFLITFLTSLALFILVNWQFGIACLIVSLLSLALSAYLAARDRAACSDGLKEKFDYCHFNAPHVIAHSFGSYLVGRLLKKFPDVRLRKTVFVSTVLPRRFPWERIFLERPWCAENTVVRSEFGTADVIVWLAGLTTWFARDIGNAGSRGFFNNPRWVHTTSSPAGDCRSCHGTNIARVHNVSLPSFEHSDQFLGLGHAMIYWLPFLWGISVPEYLQYFDYCLQATKFESQKQLPEATEIINVYWSKSFLWTNGAPLSLYVTKLIEAHLPSELSSALAAQVYRDVKTTLHVIVADLVSELGEKHGVLDDNVACYLHPATAIAAVVDARVSRPT